MASNNAGTITGRTKSAAIAGAIVLAALNACGEPYRSFSADLTFHFDCVGDASPPSGFSIVHFLRGAGFKAVDIVGVRRERNMRPMMQALYIDAVDSNHRIVNFSASTTKNTSYSVSLYTPPPTSRADALEKAILEFVSSGLRCQTRQVERNKNGPERRAYYDEYFEKVEKRVREANGEL